MATHLSSTVTRAGYEVVEAARMDARAQHGTGKSDPLDARRIAAAVLPLEPDQLRRPRSTDSTRAALRILVTAREPMTTERTATVNALTALLRVAGLGIDARKPLTAKQISEVARWRTRIEDLAAVVARSEAVRLAKRVVDLHEELLANHAHMVGLIRNSPAAELLDKTGVGPVTAAVVYTAWSHAGRGRSEAAFAALAGVNPFPASSGNLSRHRLNRGGDRRLNRALHMAVLTRMTHDPDIRAYVERRRAEGRTTKEIRRCLKRYLARQLYRTLERLNPAERQPAQHLTRHRRGQRPHTAIGKVPPITGKPTCLRSAPSPVPAGSKVGGFGNLGRDQGHLCSLSHRRLARSVGPRSQPT